MKQRVAVVGLGGIAWKAYLPALAKRDERGAAGTASAGFYLAGPPRIANIPPWPRAVGYHRC